MDRQTGRGKGEIMFWAEKARASVEEWQRVCTAEHKLKKPRSPSHTPLGPKLHGVLHSTHKQPPGKAPGCMGEAGGCQDCQQETTTVFSHQTTERLQRQGNLNYQSPLTKSLYQSVFPNNDQNISETINGFKFSYKICVRR